MDLNQRLNYLFNNQDYEQLWHTVVASSSEDYESFDLKTWEYVEKSRIYLKKEILDSIEEKFLDYLVINYPEKFLKRIEKIKLNQNLKNKWQFKQLKILYGLGRPQEFQSLALKLIEDAVIFKQYVYANALLDYLRDKFVDKTKLDFCEFMLKTIFSGPQEILTNFQILIRRIVNKEYMRHTLSNISDHLQKIRSILKNISYNDYRVQYMFLIVKLLQINEGKMDEKLTSTELMQLFLLGHDDEIVLINLYVTIKNNDLKNKIKPLIIKNQRVNDFAKKCYPLVWKELNMVGVTNKLIEVKTNLANFNNAISNLDHYSTSNLQDANCLGYSQVDVEETEIREGLKHLPIVRSDHDGVVAYIQMGLLDLAQEILEKLEVNAETIYLKFEILLRQKKYIDVLTSIQQYKDEKKLSSELSIEFRYQEAMAYWGLNKKIVARKILKTIYIEDPNYRLVKELYRND